MDSGLRPAHVHWLASATPRNTPKAAARDMKKVVRAAASAKLRRSAPRRRIPRSITRRTVVAAVKTTMGMGVFTDIIY